MEKLTVLAVAAHPDDIEFMMAGTLLLLQQHGATIHMWNLANGSCGSVIYDRDETIRRRREEAEASARVAGAIFHPPLVDDLEIFFSQSLLRRVTAGIRAIRPHIMLTPSPQDYMEDHMNTARLAVSSAFYRNMRNYPTDPPTPCWDGNLVIYHALPQGLRDGMRRRIPAGQYVDITSVLGQKRQMLAEHRSQKDWLDASQGVDSYLTEMERIAFEVGGMSRCFKAAEGWRRHSHLGFHPDSRADPLREILGELCVIDACYEQALTAGFNDECDTLKWETHNPNKLIHPHR